MLTGGTTDFSVARFERSIPAVPAQTLRRMSGHELSLRRTHVIWNPSLKHGLVYQSRHLARVFSLIAIMGNRASSQAIRTALRFCQATIGGFSPTGAHQARRLLRWAAPVTG